ALKVQVTVLEPELEALVGSRYLRDRRPVDERGPRSLFEAVAVGELAERAASRVVGRASHRTVGPLRGGVLADGAATRALAGSGRAFRATDAGVEGLGIGVTRGSRGIDGRVLVGHRVADLTVADLLLHEHATLDRKSKRLNSSH